MSRYLFSSLLFLFGLIWAVVGTPFFIIGAVTGMNSHELYKNGVNVKGAVVDKLTSRDDKRKLHYGISYTYKDASGTEHGGQKWNLSSAQWNGYQKGDSLDLVYLPSKPSRSGFASKRQSWWIEPTIWGVIGVAFALTGFVCMIIAWSKCRRKLELLRTGFPVQAQITSMEPDTSVEVNGRYAMFLRYQFTGPDGQTRQGRTQSLSRKLEAQFAGRETITVVYDPRNPDAHEADIFAVRGLN